MWTWLETLLEIMNRYGYPLVAAAFFLVFILVAMRNLWREYRSLSERYHELLVETSHLLEQSSTESDIAMQTINTALRRLGEMRRILDEIRDAINNEE
jgi:hypothetical protein